MCICVSLFGMVQYGDNQVATALICVFLFGMVQYGDNQVATALIYVCICVSVCDGSVW